jgi:hypothetical protein
MIQTMQQLELGLRVKTLKEAVEACRARQEQVKQEEAEYMDQLAQAEAEVLGHAPGSEGVQLSGLIDDNPYAKATPTEGETQQTADPADTPSTEEPLTGTEPPPA